MVGFDYARPAGTQEISENPELAAIQVDLYHHPTYQIGSGERYRPFFDVYSLGIVLLGIGAWRPIHTFHKQGQTVEEFRQRLLQHLVPQLGPEMGTIYQGAVATCLSDVLDYGAHLVTQPYQTRFRRRVVNELRKCRAWKQRLGEFVSYVGTRLRGSWVVEWYACASVGRKRIA